MLSRSVLVCLLSAPLTGCGRADDCPGGTGRVGGRCLYPALDAGDDGRADASRADGGDGDAGDRGDGGIDADGGDDASSPSDKDRDGIADAEDSCPSYWNPDGAPDACAHQTVDAIGLAGPAALLRDGRVVMTTVASGPSLEELEVTTDVWIYDPHDETFTESAEPAAALHSGGEAVRLLDGTVAFVGGGDLSGQVTSVVERYDPVDGSMQGFANLLTARMGHRALLLPDGRVLVVGGIAGREGPIVSTIEVIDQDGSVTAPWTLPGGEGGEVAASLLDDGTVLITGGGCDGPEDGRSPSHLSMVLDPDDRLSGTNGELVTARVGHQTVLLGDGRVLVVGGDEECFGGGARGIRDLEVFDPSDGSYTALVRLQAFHHRGALLALADGTALAIGGDADIEAHIEEEMTRLDGDGAIEGIDLRADELNEPRSFVQHGAVMLHDGSIVVIGGVTTGFGLATTAEHYFPPYLAVIDADGDRVVDVLDDCPADPDPDQTDGDADGRGDACD